MDNNNHVIITLTVVSTVYSKNDIEYTEHGQYFGRPTSNYEKYPEIMPPQENIFLQHSTFG